MTMTQINKARYDALQVKVAALAKARRLAREAGKAWAANSKNEVAYYAAVAAMAKLEG